MRVNMSIHVNMSIIWGISETTKFSRIPAQKKRRSCSVFKQTFEDERSSSVKIGSRNLSKIQTDSMRDCGTRNRLCIYSLAWYMVKMSWFWLSFDWQLSLIALEGTVFPCVYAPPRVGRPLQPSEAIGPGRSEPFSCGCMCEWICDSFFHFFLGKLEGVELQVSQLGTQSEITMEYGVFVDVTVFCPGSIAWIPPLQKCSSKEVVKK